MGADYFAKGLLPIKALLVERECVVVSTVKSRAVDRSTIQF